VNWAAQHIVTKTARERRSVACQFSLRNITGSIIHVSSHRQTSWFCAISLYLRILCRIYRFLARNAFNFGLKAYGFVHSCCLDGFARAAAPPALAAAAGAHGISSHWHAASRNAASKSMVTHSGDNLLAYLKAADVRVLRSRAPSALRHRVRAYCAKKPP